MSTEELLEHAKTLQLRVNLGNGDSRYLVKLVNAGKLTVDESIKTLIHKW